MTRGLTSNAREELTSKALDLAVWKRHKPVPLEKVEDALSQQVHDDANVSAIIEAVPKVNAAIAVVLIVCLQGVQDTEFNTGGITAFLNRSATDLFRRRSRAWTTLPQVPCPRRRVIWSTTPLVPSSKMGKRSELTLLRQLSVRDDNVVAIVVVDFVVLVVMPLEKHR